MSFQLHTGTGIASRARTSPLSLKKHWMNGTIGKMVNALRESEMAPKGNQLYIRMTWRKRELEEDPSEEEDDDGKDEGGEDEDGEDEDEDDEENSSSNNDAIVPPTLVRAIVRGNIQMPVRVVVTTAAMALRKGITVRRRMESIVSTTEPIRGQLAKTARREITERDPRTETVISAEPIFPKILSAAEPTKNAPKILTKPWKCPFGRAPTTSTVRSEGEEISPVTNF
jgi:hypothetical protein